MDEAVSSRDLPAMRRQLEALRRDVDVLVAEKRGSAAVLQMRTTGRSLDVALPELHDESSGRIHAHRVADYLGVSLSSLSTHLPGSYKAIHKTPDSEALQGALASIKQALVMLDRAFGERRRVRAWLNSPHPDLGGRTPISVVLEGRSEVLVDMLEAALEGLPA